MWKSYLWFAVLCFIAIVEFGNVNNAFSKNITAKIDISDQTMTVYVNGVPQYFWLVSTASKGYRTPTGTFSPFRMHEVYFSEQYNNAPMPYSVFFYKGYAIHGTTAVKSLGRPASHGCVRLDPSNAAVLFSLIKTYGPQNARIVITQ
ncbi:L,D-transpeptidase [Flexibacterium corallicola]|uniref:L,D-transpeptidase n=1 Tax=Flexibacterium corallicola TaxID=3037259 RepID=UPI00286F728B|nr:L,D-transpeptidase [Pseudovibrio sp. M1P-2-3]